MAAMSDWKGDAFLLVNSYTTYGTRLEPLIRIDEAIKDFWDTFHTLRIQPVVRWNLTREQLDQELKLWGVKPTSKYVVFYFIGHGEDGDVLFMEDGRTVTTKEIVETFAQLPKEVYKFFFIDACRGTGAGYDPPYCPTVESSLLARSTLPYQVAHTGDTYGIWSKNLLPLLRANTRSLHETLTLVDKIVKQPTQYINSGVPVVNWAREAEASGGNLQPPPPTLSGSFCILSETMKRYRQLMGSGQTLNAPGGSPSKSTVVQKIPSEAATVDSPRHPELGMEPVLINLTNEVLLKQLCYLATGIQQLHVGPGGGTFTLGRGDATLKVPPGALKMVTSVRFATILHGPFVISTGYKPGSVVVYINMDGATLVKPVCLYLSHWCSRKKKGDNTLKFIRAHHMPDARNEYLFKELEEGDFTTHTTLGVLTIPEPQCLYCVEMKEEEVARYNALSFQKYDEFSSTLFFRIQLMCDSKEWNETVEGALQKMGWSPCSSGVATFSFAAEESDEKKITAYPVDAEGPGWICTIDGHQLVSEDSFLKLKHKSKEEFDGEVDRGRFPPYIHYKVLYTLPQERRLQPYLMKVDLKGTDENLKLSFHIMQEVSGTMPTVYNPPPHGIITSFRSPSRPPQNTIKIADILRALDHQLDASWRVFGTFLNVEYGTMNSIDADQRGKSAMCMLDLVSRWVTHQEGTGDLPRTWRSVVEAVRDTGAVQLATDLAEKYGVTLSQC